MLTATIENVLNRGLPRSPRAQQLCAELTGRSVAVEVREITRLLVESNGSTLRITRGDAGADAEIVGGPFGLLALGGAAPEAVLQRGEVKIRGDAELAQKFRELLLLLRPDLARRQRRAGAPDRASCPHGFRLDAQSRDYHRREHRGVSRTRTAASRAAQ
jgi:ubiquinone biosynthesis protein UbiJ